MAESEVPEQSGPPPLVRLHEARSGAPFRFLNGQFDLKVSAVDTGGGLCVFDTWRSEPGGPPLHVHAAQDEWFFVLEGQFTLRIGDTLHDLGPGDSILGPRGVPHCFVNTTRTGRMIVAFQPAGSMEAFFAEGGAMGRLSPEQFRDLSARHGMTVVGPPLPVSP
jgi:mannose-6-phosphate isomerase-like protein (cupin superfamily)